MQRRFEYISKEAIKDAMLWSGASENEINSSNILDKFPIVYDRLTQKYISVEEYEFIKKELDSTSISQNG